MKHVLGSFMLAPLLFVVFMKILPSSEPWMLRVLRLPPGLGNPRNSEGDFIHLRDGRILFVRTCFSEGADAHSSTYRAGRKSRAGGLIWTENDAVIVPNEVMGFAI